MVAILLPYVCGAAIARGVEGEARQALAAGPDLHVVQLRFGRPAPIRVSMADELRKIPGVRSVVPRIVGELALGTEFVPVVLIGVPPSRLPGAAESASSGRAMPQFVVGAELARTLHLSEGSYLPPFYRAKGGDRVSQIVGVLGRNESVASGHVMYTALATAAEVFDEAEHATDLLVECQPGYLDAVRRKLGRDFPTCRAASRDELASQLPANIRYLDGVFHMLFVLAFAVGIPLLLVASGVGLAERRSEAALLKATGWTTDGLLLRALVESGVLCLIAASSSLILGWVWLALGNGIGIASIFLPGWEFDAALQLPYRLDAEAILVATVLSFCIVATGSLYATWRVASAPVRLILR